MIRHYRNRALACIGLGLLMFGVVALLVVSKKWGTPDAAVVPAGVLLSLVGVIIYIRGCILLVEAKGHMGSNIGAAIIISAFCLPGSILLLPILIALVLEDRNKTGTAARSAARKHRSRHGFSVERVIRWRRNALIAIYTGLIGSAVSLFLNLFDFGIFSIPDTQMAVGLLVFVVSYCVVLNGCWWWLKAKAWNEALVSIGFLPWLILYVPFVRIYVFRELSILFLMLLMMSVILVVVVWALPDRSGVRAGKSWPASLRADSRRFENASSNTVASGPERDEPVS